MNKQFFLLSCNIKKKCCLEKNQTSFENKPYKAVTLITFSVFLKHAKEFELCLRFKIENEHI